MSFEPLRAAFARLESAALKDNEWTVVHSAVGRSSGEMRLHVANNEVSSSLLPMLPRHLADAPDSEVSRTEAVPVVSIDDWLADHPRGLRHPVLLKIDTQGYEREVLDGAKTLLRSVSAVQVEVSFVPLYEGAPLYDEVLAHLKMAGFTPVSISPVFVNQVTGQVLQADVVMMKSNLLAVDSNQPSNDVR